MDNKLRTKKVMKGILLSFILLLCITAYEYNKNQTIAMEEEQFKKESKQYVYRTKDELDRILQLADDINYFISLADPYAMEQSFKLEIDCQDFEDNMRLYSAENEDLAYIHEEIIEGVQGIERGASLINETWAKVINEQQMGVENAKNISAGLRFIEGGVNLINDSLDSIR